MKKKKIQMKKKKFDKIKRHLPPKQLRGFEILAKHGFMRKKEVKEKIQGAKTTAKKIDLILDYLGLK